MFYLVKDLTSEILLKLKEELYKENCFISDYSFYTLYAYKDFYKTKVIIFNLNKDLKAYIILSNYYLDVISFFFPLFLKSDKNIKVTRLDKIKAIRIIRQYIFDNSIKNYNFACLNEENLNFLRSYFKNYEIYHERMRDDYLYLNSSFIDYKGNKLKSKRHQKAKFIQTYSNIRFVKINKINNELVLKLNSFIDNFLLNKYDKLDSLGIEEEKRAKEILSLIPTFNFDLFILLENDKIIGFSIIEKINDTIFDHVEKCDKSYIGIVPYFVSRLANYYSSFKYFNREDDSNDQGLRLSKLSFNPYKMIHKEIFVVKNDLNYLDEIEEIAVNDDIYLGRLELKDAEKYYLLSIDQKRNKFWGYDYKSDLGDKIPNKEYFYNMVLEDIKNKSSFVYIINYQNSFAGEIVLYNLLDDNSFEIGIRLIEEMENKNIAYLSIKALILFIKTNFRVTYILMKCFKENKRSDHLITRLGFSYLKEDDIFKYFTFSLL